LLASTLEVYGDPLVNPQLESNWGNVTPIGPRDDMMKQNVMLSKETCITRVQQILEWYPKVRLRDGLEKTRDYFDKK
jgi:dTDP-glucose 4,6-dehydratase